MRASRVGGKSGVRRWLRLRRSARSPAAALASIEASTPATAPIARVPLPPAPRCGGQEPATGTRHPPSAGGVLYLSEAQYLALRYKDVCGADAYRTTPSHDGAGHPVVHYHFPDGYHTTSEDAAVDRLRFMLSSLLRGLRNRECQCP